MSLSVNRGVWVQELIVTIFLSYVSNSNCKRIGPQAWLLIGNIATEVLIIFKFGVGEFPNPAPKEVIYFWVVFVTLLTAFPIYQFYLLPKLQDKSKDKNKDKVKAQ